MCFFFVFNLNVVWIVITLRLLTKMAYFDRQSAVFEHFFFLKDYERDKARYVHFYVVV